MTAARRQVLAAGVLLALLGSAAAACGSDGEDAFPAPTGPMSPSAQLAEKPTTFGSLTLRLPEGWTVAADASSANEGTGGWQAVAQADGEAVAAVSSPLSTTFPAQARQAGASLLAWRVAGYSETGAATTSAGVIRLTFTSAAPSRAAEPSASAPSASSRPGWAWIVPVTDAAAATASAPADPTASAESTAVTPSATPSQGSSAPVADSWVVLALLAGSDSTAALLDASVTEALA